MLTTESQVQAQIYAQKEVKTDEFNRKLNHKKTTSAVNLAANANRQIQLQC